MYFKNIEKVCICTRVEACADSRQMQIPAKCTRADQSVHAQSYHSICRSYMPDGKQDTCILKIFKLSIMLTSPAVRYAPAAIEFEPSVISTGNWVVLRWDRGGFAVAAVLRWVNSLSRRKPEQRFERVRGGQKILPHRLVRIFAKPPDLYCRSYFSIRDPQTGEWVNCVTCTHVRKHM